MKNQNEKFYDAIGYLVACPVVALLFYWYNYVLLVNNLGYLVWLAISPIQIFATCYLFEKNIILKYLWSIAAILLLVVCSISQVLSWCGAITLPLFK